MKKVILHVGPAKCGSSSIQFFFETNRKACKERVKFMMLGHNIIDKLNTEYASEQVLKDIRRLINKNFKSCEVLILSHEYLFQCPIAIKQLCAISSNLSYETLIVGYSRRQSDFLVSSYSQWMFRSKKSVEETQDILIANKINYILFNGLEQQFIAAVINDFNIAKQLFKINILNWYDSYKHIDSLVSDYNVKIKCNTLSRVNESTNLIEDFCVQSELTIKSNILKKTAIRKNTKFNSYFVEALNNAIIFDITIPNMHDDNELLIKISQLMREEESNNDEFINYLKDYTDEYFFYANKKLCDEYNIDLSYFSCVRKIEKSQVLEIIRQEQEKRKENPITIEYYRKLSAIMAETCLKLLKK